RTPFPLSPQTTRFVRNARRPRLTIRAEFLSASCPHELCRRLATAQRCRHPCQRQRLHPCPPAVTPIHAGPTPPAVSEPGPQEPSALRVQRSWPTRCFQPCSETRSSPQTLRQGGAGLR